MIQLGNNSLSDDEYHIPCHKCLNFDDWFSKCSKIKGISVLHLNIRSIRKNWDELILQINENIRHVDVLILSEIFCSPNETVAFNIPNFVRIDACRLGKGGGGLVMFYNSSKYKFTQLNVQMASFEGIFGSFATVCHDPLIKLDIIALYRPPSPSTGCNLQHFQAEFSRLIVDNFSYSNLLIIGDTNIDIADNSNSAVEEYQSLMASKGLVEVITDYTREEVRHNLVTKSCIDHIYIRTGQHFNEIMGGIVKTKISDHYPIGVKLGYAMTCKNYNRDNMRQSRKLNETLLKKELVNINWDDTPLDDVNNAFEHIQQKFDKAYENSEIRAEEIHRGKTNRIQKEWMTRYLRNLTTERDRLFRQWKSDPSNVHHRTRYTAFRNRVNQEIKTSRDNYYREYFSTFENDPKKTWKGVNGLLGRNKANNMDLQIFNNMRGSTQDIANKFAEQFDTGVSDLKHACNKKDRLQRNQCCNQSFYLNKARVRDIKCILDSLKENKACGFDKIRYKDLKLVSNKIATTLTNAINLSLRSGIFPECLKTSVVRPIFKKGSKDAYENYRPISLLPSIEKVLEKFVVGKLNKYIISNNIIHQNQFAFQKNKGTEDLLKDMLNYINTQISRGCFVLALFIDLSKAFDTIEYDKMIEALQEIGIVGKQLEWFKSYLKNRKYKVKVGDTFSEEKSSKHGLPQGSNLGPVLFIIYINKLFGIVQNIRIYIYADDILIISSHKDLSVAQNRLQLGFNRISKWLHDSELIINPSKTVIMNIHLRNKVIPNDPVIKYHKCSCQLYGTTENLAANCDCDEIMLVDKYDYLGITIDSGLLWNMHIGKIQNKLYSRMAVMYRLRNVINVETKKMIYKGLCESIIRYGIIAYGTASDCHMNKLYRLQLKILKILFGNGVEGLDQNFLQMANTLTPKDFFRYTILVNYFGENEYKIQNSKKTSINLRRVERLLVYLPNTVFDERLATFLVPTLYNRLPTILYNETDFMTFKTLVYMWFLHGQPEIV